MQKVRELYVLTKISEVSQITRSNSMQCLEGHVWSVAQLSYAQLTGHDRVCSIDHTHFLASKVVPGKSVIFGTPRQIGDVVLRNNIAIHSVGNTSIWGDCEVHPDLVGTVGVLGHSFSVVF